MSKFEIDFFELAFLAEACIPNDYQNFLDLGWRRIPGYENYVINYFGDVISLSRNIVRRNGHPQKIYAKLLKPCKCKKGYLFIRLNNLGTTKSIKVHQLVAMSFLDHSPCGMNRVIDHKDNNRLNNHFENLQIISNRENVVKSIDKTKTSSEFTGVRYDKKRNKWLASITIKNKPIFLGRFSSELEAANKYNETLKKIQNEEYI